MTEHFVYAEGGRRMDKGEKKDKSWHIVIGCMVVLFAVLVLGGFKLHQLNRDFRELQMDVSMLNEHEQDTEENEYTRTIDFLENEMVKYREFVKEQQDYLIWLLGILITGVAAMAGFLGLKRRKDVSDIIEEEYRNRVKTEISELIGGEERVKYLNNSIEKEVMAKNTKILFIFQDSASDSMKRVYKMLKQQKFNVSKEDVPDEKEADEKIKMWLKVYGILIYQVAKEENWEIGQDKNPGFMYIRISRMCEEKEKYGVLYCEGVKTNPHILQENFYISTANYGMTLMERLYNLLYFAKKQ